MAGAFFDYVDLRTYNEKDQYLRHIGVWDSGELVLTTNIQGIQKLVKVGDLPYSVDIR